MFFKRIKIIMFFLIWYYGIMYVYVFKDDNRKTKNKKDFQGKLHV